MVASDDVVLVAEAKGGSRRAMDELLRRHMPQILKWIPRYMARDGEARTVAMFGFMQAVLKYDTSNEAGASLDSYAAWWIRGELKKLQAREASYYALHGELSPFNGSVASDQFDKLEQKELAEGILARVPPKERMVLRECVCHDRTLEEVGRDMGYTKERIRQLRESAMIRAKRQARVLMSDVHEV